MINDVIVEGVSKRYWLKSRSAAAGASRPGLARWLRRGEEFWALRNLSFAVGRGEAVGIIGHNGAGKSTLLKLLSNITTPTRGRITIHGRLSALIEVGSGFHPELTGRENIHLCGSILGMRRREINDRLDSILEFAEVVQFADMPIKHYSSGMYVRLGFSIAAHLNPDVLLLDEVLAVGDLAFQQKCLRRIGELRDSGKTIIFVSHDLGAVERLCSRALLLSHGEIVADAPPAEAIALYQRQSVTFQGAQSDTSASARITRHEFCGGDGRERPDLHTGEPFSVRLHYAAVKHLDDVCFHVVFYDMENKIVTAFSNEHPGEEIALEPGEGVLEFNCSDLGLVPGLYQIDVGIKKRGTTWGDDLHWLHHCSILRVEKGRRSVGGKFHMPHAWTLTRNSGDAADEVTVSSSLRG